MSNPKPLSDDWLSWNPETIHRYPTEPAGRDLNELEVVPEPVAVEHGNNVSVHLLTQGLLRDIAAGVVSGLVAAVLLALLVVFFPAAARAVVEEVPTAIAIVKPVDTLQEQ